MRRRGWIVGAATVLVSLALLLGVPSLVLLLGTGAALATEGRATPTEHEVRFLVQRPADSASAVHGTLVGDLRTDDPTFTGAFEIVVASTDGRFERRDLLDLGGAFRFDLLPPGPLRIELREPRPSLNWWIEELSLHLFRPYQRSFASCEIVLRPGETRADVVLGLDPAASCRVIGWLVGADDPKLRYRVKVGRREREVSADGSFDLGLLDPDVNVLELSAGAPHPDHGTSWFAVATMPLDLEAGTMRTLQVEAPHLARISPDVRIRDSDRTPTDVWIQYSEDGDSGRWIINRPGTVLLPEGDYRVVANAAGHRLVHTTLRVAADTDELRPLFELDPASPRLVLCTDALRAPLAGSRITAETALLWCVFPMGRGQSTTDEAGIVDLGFLADRTYELWVPTDDGMSRASLEPGATSAVFEPVAGLASGTLGR